MQISNSIKELIKITELEEFNLNDDPKLARAQLRKMSMMNNTQIGRINKLENIENKKYDKNKSLNSTYNNAKKLEGSNGMVKQLHKQTGY